MRIVAALLLAAAQAQEAAGPEFTKWEFSRERVRNRVTIEAVVVNLLALDLDQVRVTVAFYDGEREIKRSQTAHVAKVAAGRSSPLTIETEHVEKFDGGR